MSWILDVGVFISGFAFGMIVTVYYIKKGLE